MLQFDAAPVVTSNPFSVSGKHFRSRNREMICEMRDRGEKPDGSERSGQPGERGARPHDQRHLPRLLNIRSAIRRDEINNQFSKVAYFVGLLAQKTCSPRPARHAHRFPAQFSVPA